MANIKSAEKRAIQSEKQREQNVGLKSMYRTCIKKVIADIAASKKDEAKATFKTLVSVLDKMVSKGIIHKNKSSRYKSRLNDQIKNLK